MGINTLPTTTEPRAKRKSWLMPLAMRVTGEPGDLFDGRLNALIEGMRLAFFRDTKGYRRIGCYIDTSDLPLFFHEYLAMAVLWAQDKWRLGTVYNPDEFSDDPWRDGQHIGIALKLMQQDAIKIYRHWKSHGSIPSSDWEDIWSEGILEPPDDPDDVPLRETALQTILRYFERVGRADGFDPFGPEQTASFGVGATPREVDILRAFAMFWKSRQVPEDEDQGTTDRVAAMERARREFVKSYISNHPSQFTSMSRPREVVMDSLKHGFHGIQKMLYVLGGLGPEGALLADDACDAAVAVYSRIFTPAVSRVANDLNLRRQLLDYATEDTVITLKGARVQARDYESRLASGTPESHKATNVLKRINSPVSAIETLHNVEHWASTKFSRSRPDCVLWDNCPEVYVSSGHKEFS